MKQKDELNEARMDLIRYVREKLPKREEQAPIINKINATLMEIIDRLS